MSNTRQLPFSSPVLTTENIDTYSRLASPYKNTHAAVATSPILASYNKHLLSSQPTLFSTHARNIAAIKTQLSKPVKHEDQNDFIHHEAEELRIRGHELAEKIGVNDNTLEPVMRTLATAGVIATLLYPLEVLQTYCMTDTKYSFKTLPLIPLVKGFGDSLRGAVVKNAVIANRDPLHDKVEDAIEKEPHLGIHDPSHTALKATVITSSIIGFFDSALTQYFANRKTTNSFEAASKTTKFNITWKNGSFKNLSLVDRLRFTTMGMPIRYVKNSLNALCCIGAVTLLKAPIDAQLPFEKYGYTTDALTTILAGTIGGTLTNGLEVIYKNQLRQGNYVEMKTPSAFQVAKQLRNETGIKTFFRGARYSIASSIIAYGVVNGIDYFFDVVDKKREEKDLAKHDRSRFFTPFIQNQTQSHDEAVRETCAKDKR